jgi:hypothetical protein
MKPPFENPEHQEFHRRRSGHGGGTRRDHVVTSTVIVGVILFLIFGAPYLKRHMSLDGALVNAIDGRDARADREPVRDPIDDTDRRPIHDTVHDPARDPIRDQVRDPDRRPVHEPIRDSARDADRDAVRRWLRANGDDPHPHEIRWWPTRELTKIYQQRLDAAREAADDDPTLADEVADIEQDGPDRVCRLQYRTMNAAGHEIACDDLFVVRQGKARRVTRSSSLASAARRYFPDGEGVP